MTTPDPFHLNRRQFIATTAAGTAAATGMIEALAQDASAASLTNLTFDGPDSLFHGHQWQTLNPGYWQVQNGALRRRLSNYGDRARRTGFPYHGETHGFEFSTDYDPSLDAGILYTPIWDLEGSFTLQAEFTYCADRPGVKDGDSSDWLMYQDGYGLMGIAFGSKCLYESYNKAINTYRAVWTDDQKLMLLGPPKFKRASQGGDGNLNDNVLKSVDAMPLKEGDKCSMTVRVEPIADGKSRIQVTFASNGKTVTLSFQQPSARVAGYTGIASRGLIDFEVNRFEVQPGQNQPKRVGVADCLACYPLGDSLKQVDGKWMVRFVGMFGSDGQQVEIRVADTELPDGGWQSVPIAGQAKIVNNEWRRNTSVVEVTLPQNPSATDLYYTVWKDGVDVTADDRIGSDGVGAGTGLVGDVPGDGNYVGRLPRLTAPYKLCGLSCHSVLSGLQQRTDKGWGMKGGRDRWQFRDQPTVEAYKHLEDYDFQVMVWEDDVWYMELVLYPPSTDDAYKIIELSICGPTSRWQLMRHWNVINPGDHDYGMDDVKGPEQIIIRNVDGLGQDPSYMRRNFQIVHHLITGEEDVDPRENPKKWRAWKMPNRDFTFIILDSRLWRSSQDVDIWDDQGWDAFKSLYDRTDPTRSLLGEEQFGWLQEVLATDSSPLICLTGINGMHTVWTGAKYGKKTASMEHPKHFAQRDRVAADYAGWVKAGSDRVLELLGERNGVVTVYGDVHNGCLMRNVEHRVIECSFGPIGRTGGRALIPGFGPRMKDVDERDLEVFSLYHKEFADADQSKHAQGDPMYWNFLEMEFDPRPVDPTIGMRLRNLVDAPDDPVRGGGSLETTAAETGRPPTCTLPVVKTLPNSDVFLVSENGKPIRGTRSDSEGVIRLTGLADVEPGTRIIVNAFDGEKADSQVVVTG